MKRSYITRKTALRRSTERRLRRSVMRYNAPRVGTRRCLKARLDSLTAQIVKMRDGHACVQCGDTFLIDCGHVYSRRLIATRWALDNTFAQCRRHNTLHISQPAIYLCWYAERFGSEALMALHERAYSGKTYSDEELKQMVSDYEQRLEGLRVERSCVAA